MRLLFVCTGNICRSPVAERSARALVGAACGTCGAGIGIASAGTHALVGADMHPLAAAALRGLGGEHHGFHGRQLTAELIEESDLVLTMTRRQRREVLNLAPGALRRTFTLYEAATLIGGSEFRIPPVDSPDDHGRAIVGAIGTARALRPGSTRDDDIEDPLGLDSAGHEATACRIYAALVPLVDAVCSSMGLPRSV